MALALFAVPGLFPLEAVTRRISVFLCASSAPAHGSPFYVDVPIALNGGRTGDALWPVLAGSIWFMLIVDATLITANAVVCLAPFVL